MPCHVCSGGRCDDEEMIPLTRIKKGFTSKELDQLANPKLLGGKTVGEELGGLGCCAGSLLLVRSD